MKLTFTERAWEDYLLFQANERKLLRKLIRSSKIFKESLLKV